MFFCAIWAGDLELLVELRTKIALQINDRRRRIGGGHRNIVAGRVALVEAAIEGGLRQLDGAFDNYLSPNGFSSESDSEKENRISVAHRYSGYSEKGASLAPIPAFTPPRAPDLPIRAKS